MNNNINCTLLGGSNSVLRFGLGSGLESICKVKRLALGATTCIQNLYETVRNRDAIKNSDFVVTESNVNDSHFACMQPLSISTLESEINEYYRTLSELNRNVYVIILPANFRARHIESQSVMEAINNIHYSNCLVYGYKVIDLSWIARDLPEADIYNLIPHPRHLNEGYLHILGQNIARHASAHPCSLTPINNPGPNYSIISAPALDKEFCIEKKNSAFNEQILPLNKSYSLPEWSIGTEIVALSAWCDSYSQFRITTDSVITTKCFSKLYSVWEFAAPIKISATTKIETAFDNRPPTDLSRMSKYNAAANCVPFGFSGLLVRDGTPIQLPAAEYEKTQIDISSEVAPDIRPYIKACHSLIENRYLYTQTHIDELKNEIETLKLKLAVTQSPN